MAETINRRSIEPMRRALLALGPWPVKPPLFIGHDAIVLDDILIDMSVEEADIEFRIERYLAGKRDPGDPIRIDEGLEARIRQLSMRYPNRVELRELELRRKAIRRLANLLGEATSATVLAEPRPSLYLERLYCAQGTPPTLGNLMRYLRRHGHLLSSNDFLGVIRTRQGWARAVLGGSDVAPVWVEIHRPASQWIGAEVRGSVEEQVEEAVAENMQSPSLRAQLRRTKFIVALASDGDINPTLVAIRDFFVANHGAWIRPGTTG